MTEKRQYAKSTVPSTRSCTIGFVSVAAILLLSLLAGCIDESSRSRTDVTYPPDTDGWEGFLLTPDEWPEEEYCDDEPDPADEVLATEAYIQYGQAQFLDLGGRDCWYQGGDGDGWQIVGSVTLYVALSAESWEDQVSRSLPTMCAETDIIMQEPWMLWAVAGPAGSPSPPAELEERGASFESAIMDQVKMKHPEWEDACT